MEEQQNADLPKLSDIPKDDLTAAIEEMLQGMSNFLGIGFEYDYELEKYMIEGEQEREVLKLNVFSDSNEALLIGYHGKGLGRIEYLMKSGLSQRFEQRVPLTLDIGNYREERAESIRANATETAQEVIESGQEVALRPMRASERLVVHKVLAESEQVKTESRGMGRDRHVVIMPA